MQQVTATMPPPELQIEGFDAIEEMLPVNRRRSGPLANPSPTH